MGFDIEVVADATLTATTLVAFLSFFCPVSGVQTPVDVTDALPLTKRLSQGKGAFLALVQSFTITGRKMPFLKTFHSVQWRTERGGAALLSSGRLPEPRPDSVEKEAP